MWSQRAGAVGERAAQVVQPTLPWGGHLTIAGQKKKKTMCLFFVCVFVGMEAYLGRLRPHQFMSSSSDLNFKLILEKVPPYGRHFPSFCGGLQPSAAMVGPFGPSQKY